MKCDIVQQPDHDLWRPQGARYKNIDEDVQNDDVQYVRSAFDGVIRYFSERYSGS